MGWNKIKEWLHYNFGSVATKQHVASMLIDQQQNSTENLQEYVQRFSNILLKSSGLLLHEAKDLAHITCFICNLHNQKLQHYVLGKNPTSVQNAIHSDKYKCKSHYINDEVYENIGQLHTSKNTKSDPEDIEDSHDSDSPDSNFYSSSDFE